MPVVKALYAVNSLNRLYFVNHPTITQQWMATTPPFILLRGLPLQASVKHSYSGEQMN
jgi:hypothetical protein